MTNFQTVLKVELDPPDHAALTIIEGISSILNASVLVNS